MPSVIHFATGWHWANGTGIVNRLAVAGANCQGFIADPSDGGGRAAGFNDSNDYLIKNLPLSDTFTLHLWGRRTAGTAFSGGRSLVLRSGTDEYLYLRGGNDLQLVFKGSNLGQVGPGWESFAHYRLEVFQHASEGTIKAWQNNVQTLDLSGLNTTDPHGVDRIRFVAGAYSPTRNGWYTHIILANENLGSSALVGYDPAASDHAPLEWAKSDAGLDFYEHLSAVPTDADDRYLRSPTTGVGEKTRHGVGLELPGRRIIGARPVIVARTEEEASDKVKVSLLSGTADPVEEESPVDNTAYIVSDLDWSSEDPDTEEEWTDEGIAAAQVEVEHLGP